MPNIRKNALNPAIDISGTINQSSSVDLLEEPLQIGLPVVGQSGTTLLILSIDSGVVTVTGLDNFTNKSIGRFIFISGASDNANNGIFKITEVISSSSIKYINALATLLESNNGSISWTEREPYTLENDLNFVRTDRKKIKGTPSWYDTVPTYIRPSNLSADIPTDLTNVSGKTLDAKLFIIEKKISNVSINVNDTFVKITDLGNLKHASSNDLTGVPLFDTGPYFLDFESCYVEIINPITQKSLETLTNSEQRIFGLTRDGSSTSPDSIEIEFRYVSLNQNISTSSVYFWETGQTALVDIYYGLAVQADQLSSTAFRKILTNGIIGNSSFSSINRVVLEVDGKIVYVNDGDIVLKI